MNIFDFRNRIVADYAAYVNSFIAIRDERIQQRVKAELDEGFLWPERALAFKISHSCLIHWSPYAVHSIPISNYLRKWSAKSCVIGP